MSEGKGNGPIRIASDKAKKHYDQGEVTVLAIVDSEIFDNLDYKIRGAKHINPEDIKGECTQMTEGQPSEVELFTA